MIDRTKVIVVDLDGTLYDHSHRQEHMQNREWDKYHSMLSEDTVFQDVRLFVGAFTDRYPFVVISVTGRPEQYREESMIKLHKDRILLDEVLMRPDNDFSSDGPMKVRLLNEWLSERDLEKEDVVCILDDRDSVVDAWRAAGFRCWQVKPGGY